MQLHPDPTMDLIIATDSTYVERCQLTLWTEHSMGPKPTLQVSITLCTGPRMGGL